MNDRWQFLLNRIGELLWVKPLLMGVVSLIAALVASAADDLLPFEWLPDISFESVQSLLTISSSSMLVIATFAVGSMVSAYASATTTGTPRAFALVVSDDVSQNALSVFIGAFIFSIVALVALLNGFYGQAGRFTLFVMTLLVFASVILTFVRWVDQIARLGRLETTIGCVETATVSALDNWRRQPNLGGVAVTPRDANALAVVSDQIGYVQHIEIRDLQEFAESTSTRIEVATLPGNDLRPQRVLAYVVRDAGASADLDLERVARAFRIGNERTFDEDPRFGLVVLSEIASRALSTGVNDSGTAIQVIASLIRIFAHWAKPAATGEAPGPRYDRVAVPQLSTEKMFEDAFRAIARDGASSIEVSYKLQRGLHSLADCGHAQMRAAAMEQSRRALARAENALTAAEDRALVRELAQFALTE
jgi:uncharacterized membrane protein